MTRIKSRRIELPAEVYPHEAILRAATATLGDCRYVIGKSPESDGRYIVTIDPHEGGADCTDAEANFLRELHEEALRYAVAARTSTLRNLMIGRALYQTCLQLPTAKEERGRDAANSTDK